MGRIDPTLLPVLTDMERGLRELGIPFAVVGALVPELLLDIQPTRATHDADVTVTVASLPEFDALKGRLAAYGFEPTKVPLRLRHRDGGLLDILPYSDTIAPTGRLQLPPDTDMNMSGFRHVVTHAVPMAIEGGPTVPLAPLPLYVLLKLVAFGDRKAPKDLASVLHCLEHYQDEDDRRYGVEYDGAGVPFEYTCAYLLGSDARPYLDEPLARAVVPVLDRFTEPEAEVVWIVGYEKSRTPVHDEERREIFEHFHWFRLGTGI